MASDLRSACTDATCSGGLYEVLLADGASRVMCTRHGLVTVH